MQSALAFEGLLQDLKIPDSDETYTSKNHELYFDIFCPCNDFDPALVNEAKEITFKSISKDNKAKLASLFLKPFIGRKSRSLQEKRDTFQKLMQKKSSLIKLSAIGLRYIYLDAIFRTPLGEKISGLKVPQDLHNFQDDIVNQFSSHTLPSFKKGHLEIVENELQVKNKEIDYLIVGSGPAAAVLGYELVHKGYTVVMIEQGPFVVPHSVKTTQVPELKENKGSRLAKGSGIIIKNGQTAGGGTTVNIDLAFPPTEESVRFRMNQWINEGKVDPNLFSEKNISNAYEWVKKKIGTRELGESEVNPNNQILWEGSLQLGSIPKRYHLNREYGTHKKLGALEKLIIPAMLHKKNPLTFLSEVQVEKVLFNKNHSEAIGLKCNRAKSWPLEGKINNLHDENLPQNKSFTIKARNIILSAGSLGSSVILQKSSNHFKNSGKGVIFHPSMAVLGVFDKEIKNQEGLTTSVFNDSFVTNKKEGYIFESASAYPWTIAGGIYGQNIQETFDIMKNYKSIAGFGIMLVDSVNQENKVEVNLFNKVKVHYKLSINDQNRLKSGLLKASEMMFKAGANKIIVPTFEDKNIFSSLKEAQATIKNLKFKKFQNAITSAHMQSTNKMGGDPESSVIDHQFRVWNYSNFFIVDGSLFPTSVGANPMQSIYTMGKIFADSIPHKQ
jgi:hypothetical protein